MFIVIIIIIINNVDCQVEERSYSYYETHSKTGLMMVVVARRNKRAGVNSERKYKASVKVTVWNTYNRRY